MVAGIITLGADSVAVADSAARASAMRNVVGGYVGCP